MAIDFSALMSSKKSAPIEPHDIFMSLPNKAKEYGYPRDVQSEVWKQWYHRRNEKNLVIQMNVDSGKTIAGLVILQSCLNEKKGPAVYVAPDNRSVSQVCREAEKLGIRVAYDQFDKAGVCIKKGEKDFFFVEGGAILVTNVRKLVNGRSIFGLRKGGGNIRIESVIMDDIYACMDIIRQQYTIQIHRDSPVYTDIVQTFGQHRELKNSQTFYSIAQKQSPSGNALIPLGVWQEDCEKIYRLLLSAADDDKDIENIVSFHLPLLTACWESCSCVLTASCIKIVPKDISVSKRIASFYHAKRRIFMSAVSLDNSEFASMMGLTESEIANIIIPEKEKIM